MLIVDDNADHRAMYTRYLAFHGFRVETAVDGQEGVVFAQELRPAAIVMDLALPHLDGWEATRRLKASPTTQHIPIIACTGHVIGASAERALDAGCDAYVAKPCKPEDLLAEIRRLLARPVRADRVLGRPSHSV